MAKVDFTDILSQQVGSAPEPKPLPEGTYFGTIAELPANRLAKTKEGDKPIVAFKIALNEAGDDVDPELLAEAGGLMLPSGEPKKMSYEFWIDETSRYRLDRFLASFGVSGSYKEAFEEMPGKEVQIFVTLDTYNTKSGEERTVNNVKTAFARE